MKYLLISLYILWFFSPGTFCQTPEGPVAEKEYHAHHKNEIAVAVSPVYLVKEKIFEPGIHLHAVRTILNTNAGIGISYERIFGRHQHNTFGFVMNYQPVEDLNFNLSPGLAFEDKERRPVFALHLESSYEIELNNFHIGPALELAYDPEDYHISLGIHLGYGF